MESIVSRASELLQTMVDEGTTPKLMAHYTDYSYQQTWKYIQGEATPTPDFLNRLFGRTGDLRIVQLIADSRPVVICEINPTAKVNDTDLLREIIEQRRMEIKREDLLLDMLADGRIDESDKTVMEAYFNEFSKGVSHASGLRDLIARKYNEATEAKR